MSEQSKKPHIQIHYNTIDRCRPQGRETACVFFDRYDCDRDEIPKESLTCVNKNGKPTLIWFELISGELPDGKM